MLRGFTTQLLTAGYHFVAPRGQKSDFPSADRAAADSAPSVPHAPRAPPL